MTEAEAPQSYPVAAAALTKVIAMERHRAEVLQTIRDAVGAPAEFVLDLSARAFVPPKTEEELAKDDS